MAVKKRNRGVAATDEGLKKLKDALREKGWDLKKLSIEANLSEDTVRIFFREKRNKRRSYEVDRKPSATPITEKLGLKLEEVIGVPSSPPPLKEIDWHEICTRVLEKQITRQYATERGLGHEVKVYVPLGLVKPKRQPRRSESDRPNPEQGMLDYQLQGEKEVAKRYEHEEFLGQIIGKAGKNLAIIGEPGAGKTTWLDQILRYLCLPPLTPPSQEKPPLTPPSQGGEPDYCSQPSSTSPLSLRRS